MIDIDTDLPLVQADPKRISQVLINLVANAAKFSEPNTSISVNAKKYKDGIRVDVMDKGLGIPLDQRAIVFEVFRQLDDVTWQSTIGSGLGLAICKGFVEAHGGSIWIGEVSSPGTTISFSLLGAEK